MSESRTFPGMWLKKPACVGLLASWSRLGAVVTAAVGILLALGESSAAESFLSGFSPASLPHLAWSLVWPGHRSGLLCLEGTFPQEPLSIAQTWTVSAVRGQGAHTASTGPDPREGSPGQDGAGTWPLTPGGAQSQEERA